MSSPPPRAEIRKVLIVRTSALGDIVHVLPSLSALRAALPGARVAWLVEPAGAGLLETHPEVAEVFVIPRQEWKRWARDPRRWPALARDMFRLWRRLRRERFDLVLDFHGNLRSTWMLLMAGGRRRLGFHRRDVAERGGALLTGWKASRAPARLNKVEKNLLLIRELGFAGACPRGTVHVPAEDREWARGLFASLPGAGPRIAIHPAVSRFGELKRWPAERFRELIDLLVARHDARVLITWAGAEREIAESVGRPTLLPEPVPLIRFAALLEAADLVIAADTGALPLAAVLGTPAVGLFGPKDPVVYAPYPEPVEVVTSTAPCSPCRLRSCEHRICMAVIPAAAALAAAERALARGRRAAADLPALAGQAGAS
jgi:lipopolysaccharide heptosyltransferase I